MMQSQQNEILDAVDSLVSFASAARDRLVIAGWSPEGAEAFIVYAMANANQSGELYND